MLTKSCKVGCHLAFESIMKRYDGCTTSMAATGSQRHWYIAVGRLRILGGQGLEYWGGQGLEYWGGGGGGGARGANSQQAHYVVITSMRRYDVASTSFRRHVPTRFLTNQCQIITFLILKSDIIENSRIELKGIVLQIPSNQSKVTFIIILPFNLVHL